MEDTKTITMPLSEYNQLTEKADKLYVEQCGVTESEVSDLRGQIEALHQSRMFWQDKYKNLYSDYTKLRNELKDVLEKQVKELEKENERLRNKKWYQIF